MTGSAKRKGDKGERAVAKLLTDAGYNGRRVPLSGSVKTDGAWKSDVRTTIQGEDYGVEVKSWARNFPEYEMLKDSDMVFKRTIRVGFTGAWLVVIPWVLMQKLITPNDIDRKKIEYADRLIKSHMTGNGSFLKILEEFKTWGKAVAEQPARKRIETRRQTEC